MIRASARVLAPPLLLAASLHGSPLTGQESPELVRSIGDLDTVILVDVRAAASGEEGWAVLTAPSPAVHVFGPDGYESWGREGGGPAELSSPVDLAWSGASLLVLDVNHRKIVSFGAGGQFLASRSVEDWANRLFAVGGDTILGTFSPMAGGRAVVRLAGDGRDTVRAYETTENRVRLEAEGAPSLTVAEPFTPEARWTILDDGVLAWWSPGSSHLSLVGLDGRERARVEVPDASLPVGADDREAWFAEAIPEEFMGRRVFEPLRQRAREVIRFPETFPLVMELLGDPSGGIWIRRNTAATGQVWHLVARDGGELGRMRLPPGRRLLGVTPSELAVRSEDELGVERIEIYRRPEWSPGRPGAR